jgi:hypothetical protein
MARRKRYSAEFNFPDHQLSAIMRLEVSYGEKETI